MPRMVFETSLRNSESISIPTSEERFQKIAVNVEVQPDQWLVKPYDIAAKQGLIVVSDTSLSAVHVFDVRRKKLFAIGWRGQVQLVNPLGVAIDDELNIYVADAGLKAVVKFDSQGHFKSYIGKPEHFSRITDVAVSNIDKRVYVLDRGGVESSSHRFQIYNQAGELQRTVGKRGVETGMFNHPIQIDTDNEGNVYVLDSGNFRVQQFTPAGDFIRKWGRLGKGLGSFARPRGMAVSRDSHVLVSDSAFQNFQIFNNEGQLLLNVGEGGGPDLPGRYLLPAGIAADETDRIYIVDQMRQKIDVFRLLSQKEIEVLLNK